MCAAASAATCLRAGDDSDVGDECSPKDWFHVLMYMGLGTATAMGALQVALLGRTWWEDVRARHPGAMIVLAVPWRLCFGTLGAVNLLENHRSALPVALAAGASMTSFLYMLVYAQETSQSLPARLLWALAASLAYFPLFAVHQLAWYRLGLAIGAVYSLALAALTVLYLACRALDDDTLEGLGEVPQLVCLLALCGIFVRRWFRAARGVPPLYDHQRRVRELLSGKASDADWRGPGEDEDEDDDDEAAAAKAKAAQAAGGGGCCQLRPRLGRFWRRLTGGSVPYPPRVLLVLVVSTVVLLNAVLLSILLAHRVAPFAERLVSSGRCCNGGPCGDTAMERLWNENLDVGLLNCDNSQLVRSAMLYTISVAGALAAVYQLVSLALLAVNAKATMRHVLRGSRHYLPPGVELSQAMVLLGALSFAGTQVVAMFLAWATLAVLVQLVFVLIAFVVVLPALDVYDDVVWTAIFEVAVYDGAPGLIPLSVLVLVVSLLVVRLFFWDPHSRKVRATSADHRVYFQNYDFFQLSLSLLTGVTEFLLRFVLGLATALLFVGRLDMTLVPRGFEPMDRGYRTFVGALMLDAYYNNPVMLTFVQLLQAARPGGAGPGRARRRWAKAYTLVRNPSVAAHHRIVTARAAERRRTKEKAGENEVYVQSVIVDNEVFGFA